MLRMLLRRRWLGFAALVIVLVVVFVNLGLWQFDRYGARHARNERVSAGATAGPVPVQQIMAVGRPGSVDDEYRPVTVSGRYSGGQELLVAGRAVAGRNGFVVLTPLLTDAGPVLLVARGWVPAAEAGAATEPPVPAAPSGPVSVTGRVRWSEEGSLRDARLGSRTQVRVIDVESIGRLLGRSVLPGYVELTGQNPPADAGLTVLPLPELDDGPHLSYGVQWFLFALFAVGAYFYFAVREWRDPGMARSGGTCASDGAVASRSPFSRRSG